MPGCERHTLESMLREVGESFELGVKTFVLFPKVPDELKTNLGVEAYNPDGIVPRAVRMIKAAYPESIVCTDVALDPYSNQGHDGVVEDGKILNDVTINQLCKQAVCQARAGADVVAPSDMMVGGLDETFVFDTWKTTMTVICDATANACPPFFNYDNFPRMDVLRLFAMHWTLKDLLMFPFCPTLPSTHRLTTAHSVTHWIRTRVLEIRKRISKIQPMDASL